LIFLQCVTEIFAIFIAQCQGFIFLQFSDAVDWSTRRASYMLKNCGWWFGPLHVLQLQLSPPPLVILSSNKIHTGDILVLAYPDPSGKW